MRHICTLQVAEGREPAEDHRQLNAQCRAPAPGNRKMALQERQQ